MCRQLYIAPSLFIPGLKPVQNFRLKAVLERVDLPLEFRLQPEAFRGL